MIDSVKELVSKCIDAKPTDVAECWALPSGVWVEIPYVRPSDIIKYFRPGESEVVNLAGAVAYLVRFDGKTLQEAELNFYVIDSQMPLTTAPPSSIAISAKDFQKIATSLVMNANPALGKFR